MLRLPRLVSAASLVTTDGKPTATFAQWWQTVVQQIETAIGLIVKLTGIQDQFDEALKQAQAATATAQEAAAAAQAAADAAAAQTAANNRETSLQASYIEPTSALSATTTVIMIAAHTRHYGDGTSAPVAAGTVNVTAAGDTDYISYSDPLRVGGHVSYEVSLDAPVQTGDTHVVGAVMIPITGSSVGGQGPRKPGFVEP